MIKEVFLIMLLAASVSALNDAYLTVDGQGSGICLGLDGIQSAACDNETLRVGGESDHFLYVLPGQPIAQNATTHDKLTFMFLESRYFLTGNFAWALVLCLVILAAASAIILLARSFLLGRRRRP